MNKNKIITILSSLLSIILGLFAFTFLKKRNKSTSSLNKQLNLSGKPAQSEKNTQEIIDNSNMISEGSQFGVQYYDEHKKIH